MFRELCLLADIEAGVGVLADDNLRSLYGWLSRENHTTGVPGLVRGLVIAEAAERWLTKGGRK